MTTRAVLFAPALFICLVCLALAAPVWAAGAEAGTAAPDTAPAAGAEAAPAGDAAPVSAEEIAEGIALCAAFPVGLTLDGVPVESDVPPLVVRGRTLIPARALFERVGASISWDEIARRVVVSTSAAGIVLTIDSFEYAINGNIYNMDVPPLLVGDRTMIPVRVAAESLGLRVGWDEPTRTVAVARAAPASPPASETSASPPAFASGPARAGEAAAQGEVSRGGQAAREYAAGVLPQLNPAFVGFSVVIDAGHGGVDSGAVGEESGQASLLEKDVNLDVALRLEAHLRSAGLSVHMIRGGDYAVDIYERPQIANGLGAKLYVSIHNNSSEKPNISGTSTYYYNKEWAASYPLDSETLAIYVQKAVSARAGLPDLGVHDGPAYIVLNRTAMPAIIVEGAFLSNASDRALMATDAYREAYAFGVALGLIDALNERASAPGTLSDMMPVGL